MKNKFSVRRVMLLPPVMVLCGIGVSSRPASAQLTAPQRLWNAKSLACVFTVVSTGNWKDGQAHAEVTPAKFSLSFEAIDTDEGTARVVGAMGRSEIVVKLSNGTLHFVQSLDDGPVYLTSVFPKETTGGRLQAVHTRHEFTEVQLTGFTSRPEQYIGDCAPAP
jgi:hypothetical protein